MERGKWDTPVGVGSVAAAWVAAGGAVGVLGVRGAHPGAAQLHIARYVLPSRLHAKAEPSADDATATSI